ncbi:MAG: permease [Bacteroidetes bacterium]|nr:permease [Bacteroidota bacterium]
MEQIPKIATFIFDSFIHIWPYLLITIPLSVAVNLSGASAYLRKALSYNPLFSILLATFIGALSPFCSCGVIPLIASLLIGGVPLAPVMSFWIASPSMDPEIFFLSTATIGWKLSVWRLVATFVISLSAGLITHVLMQKGLIDRDVLRKTSEPLIKTPSLSGFIAFFRQYAGCVEPIQKPRIRASETQATVCCTVDRHSCCTPSLIINQQPLRPKKPVTAECCTSPEPTMASVWPGKLLKETLTTLKLISKFMAWAFFFQALITFYLPTEVFAGYLGGNGPSAVLIATLLGIPVYTSNITALPLTGSLLSLGMNQGAALAFLIAGPTTTLPAMVAVWGIAKPKIFLLYLSFTIFGALAFGMLVNLVAWFCN